LEVPHHGMSLLLELTKTGGSGLIFRPPRVFK